jgi:transposase
MLAELIDHCLRAGLLPELNKLARTLKVWFAKICNFHIARIGYGFTNFENYRIRALLYAGKPNWRVLGSIVVQ